MQIFFLFFEFHALNDNYGIQKSVEQIWLTNVGNI